MEYNKEKLKKVFFEFNGEYSYDYFLDIIDWNHMDCPALIIEQERVPGSNKDVFYSEGTYKNKVIDIECYVDIRHDLKRKDVHIKRIKQWLMTNFEYKKLRFSDDEGYYEGLCISNMLFKEKVEGLYETLISFTCDPLKKRNENELVFDFNTTEINLNNKGVKEAPVKIDIVYPNTNNVYGFTIEAVKDGEVIYTFDCNAPAKGTHKIEIDSEEYNIRAITSAGVVTSAVSIANNFTFPYMPNGDVLLKIKAKTTNEAYYPVIKVKYNELEL